jgi:hypothetical protein
MAYLGNSPTSQAFAPGTDTFSGTGSQTAFTLSRNVISPNDILVVVNNVDQQPSNYTVSGTTLTFSPAPSSGTNNIYVRYLSTNLQTIAPQAGSVGKQGLDVGNSNGTGAAIMPTGTTAQRPSIPLAGMYRLNTTTNTPEWYSSAISSWFSFSSNPSYSVEYLVIAGGGGGVSRNAQVGCAGSGAGGVLNGSFSATLSTAYTITVGAGGAGYSTAALSETTVTAASGANSSLGSVATAIGGGGGSGGNGGTASSGGSGGGAGAADSAATAGSGTSGQGFAGGSGTASPTNSVRAGGGGGGATAAGGNASSGTCGAGGAGTSAYSIWGAATSTGQNVGGTYWYAGGSGGASTVASTTPQASGGNGGGATGKAGISAASPGNNGQANTGGGGGPIASQVGGTIVGGNGGSGVVIIRYAGSQVATGGTVTSSGGYTYHTFTTSGTFTA